MTVTSSEASRAPLTTNSPSLSRLLRRVHLFAGLFLAPWMLMYALSTLVMTHRSYVLSFYPSANPVRVVERELNYSRSFAASSSREHIAKAILQDLGLDGAHTLSGGRNGEPLVINRQHAFRTRRITFDGSRGNVTIQREEFRWLSFLERMHRRRGYDTPYVADDTWGFTVDLAVLAMMFWSISGILLWWELKAERRLGVLAAGAGLALYALFLFFL